MEFKPFKIGRYLLLEKLATGGMAEVYRASASGAGGFQKQLAIKRILPNYTSNDEFQRMFEYEARLSSMLTHSNIVQVYDFVKSGETYLLAMEYVNGKNLRQVVNKIKKLNVSLPIEVAIYIINETCKGLDYAHSKKDELTGKQLNIIHRDMSPQNIMLSYDGAVKIVDFGIAKAKDKVDETRSGVIKGKFGYMSPEQANGNPIEHHSDIFSTGIILWELLTGRRLFTAESDLATLKKIQECDIQRPSTINPRITPELERIIMKSLAKDINSRYTSAGNFHRSLQEYLNKFYPSFTVKELADILHRVFDEEIRAEGKRYEQLLKQSVPFSQGEKADPNPSEFADVEEAVENSSVTSSETGSQTAITFVDDEDIKNELGEPSQTNKSASSRSLAGNQDSTSIATRQNVVPAATQDRTVVNPVATEKDRSISQSGQISASIKSVTEERQLLSDKTQIAQEDAMPLYSERNRTESETKPPSPTEGATLKLRIRPTETYEEENQSHVQLDRQDKTQVETQHGVYPKVRKRHTIRGMGPESLSENTGSIGRPSPWRDDQHQVKSKSRGPLAMFSLALAAGTVFYLYRLLYSGSVPTIVEQIEPGRTTTGVTPRQSPPEKQGLDSSLNDTPNPKMMGECIIEFETEPSGAKLIIGKEERGETPTKVLVPCQKDINYSLVKDGFDSFSENVLVKKKQEKINRTLREIPTGILELTINHPVDIFLADKLIVKAEANKPVQIPLRAGVNHKLRFVNSWYNIDSAQSFAVEKGYVNRKLVRFEDLQGRKPSSKPKRR